jgi:periplasmic protein TonB
MDLESNLIESTNRKQRGGWKASLAAVGVHGLIVGFILFMTAATTHKINAEDKPIRAFVVSSAAPPPPPPPPPPAGASHPAAQQVVKLKPVEVPKSTFVQPHEIPKQVPVVQTPITQAKVDLTPAESSEPAGEAGGVEGGVSGGVAGGVVGGVVGGQVGGQLGGQIGGVLGGTPGGTGTDKDAAPAPPPPPPPPPPVAAPSGPMRVGGDVKAPSVIKRVEPDYTETARKGRITGVVIIEAIINKNGDVEQVRVLKGLPLGLSEKAEDAVKQWKFKPGTLNGEPVPVIFDLTVNFTMQ